MGAIDADAHVIETPQTWSYFAESEKHLVPRLLNQTAGGAVVGNAGEVVREFWMIEDRAFAKDRNVGLNTAKESREMQSVAARLRHMDELDIEVQVLYPTLFLRPVTQDPAGERACCRSYNRWLADLWKDGEGRLRWVAKVPTLSLDTRQKDIRDELVWCKDHGACGIFLRGLECEKALGDPYFYPLWQMASDLDMPIAIHSGDGSFIHHALYGPDTSFTRFKLAVVGAFHTLLEKEVPARFPKVRWGFVEVSAQWVPYVLNDLADRFRRKGKPFPKDALDANNMWVACENTDDIDYVLRHTGEDKLMIGTDYGHHDPSTELNAIRLLRQDKRVSPAVATKILERNPRAFYGLS